MLRLKNSLAWFAIVVLLASCSKDDDEGPSQVLSATVGGSNFSAELITGSYDPDTKVVSVSGLTDDLVGFNIVFSLDVIDAAGEYFPEDGEVDIFYYDENFDLYEAESGSINVTRVSETRFEATFNVVVENDANEEITVSNGVVKADVEEF
jgi:hypothetical protein